MNPVARLADVYVRLFEELPALSRGASNENSAGYLASVDPRRAPLRVEVSDLIHEIEVWTLEARASGSPGRPNLRVRQHLETLRRWYDGLAEEQAEVVRDEIGPLLAKGRRLLGEAPPAPVPLIASCPNGCGPALFRVETPDGVVSACSTCKGRWDEEEWAEVRRGLVRSE